MLPFSYHQPWSSEFHLLFPNIYQICCICYYLVYLFVSLNPNELIQWGMQEAAFKMLYVPFFSLPCKIQSHSLPFLYHQLYVLIMYVTSHCHGWWNLRKVWMLAKETQRGKKTSISVLRKSTRAWPHAGNHMLSLSSPCDVCWEENHGTSEEDIVSKGMLYKTEFKTWRLTEMNVGPNC